MDPFETARRIACAAVAALIVAVAAAAQQSPTEWKLVHRSNEGDLGSSTLVRLTGEIRVEGFAEPTADDAGTRLRARVEFDEKGWVRNYERELRTARDGTLVSRVSITATDTGARGRESGPVGSRTRTVVGPAFDAVVDAAAPELLIPPLLDPARVNFRALVLPDWEIRTVVIETREAGARFVALTGGGFTVARDSAGRFARMVLPGTGAREIVPAGTASRAARPHVAETRATIDAGEVRIGWTLALPKDLSRPVPFALFLGDAGERDRDGVGPGSQAALLAQLAADLAERGFATARFDKRGAGESRGPEPGLKDLVNDAVAVLDAASKDPRIARDRVVAVGHGEGALVACELARGSAGRVQSIVTLAGPGRGIADSLEARLRVTLGASGEKDENIEAAVAAVRNEIAELKQLAEDAPSPAGQKLMRDLARRDPASLLAEVSVPALVIHGAADPFVPPAHVALLRASLAFSTAGRVRFQLLDHADHDFLLVPEGTAAGRTPGGADVARSLHPSVGALIADFCRGNWAESRPSAPTGGK